MNATMPDGLYLSMDDDVYFEQQRVGSTDLAKLLSSPARFWASSWMNKSRADRGPDSDAKIAGHAYHCARLEPDRFASEYVRDVTRDEWFLTYNNEGRAATTDAEVKAALKDLGLPQTKAGETVMDRAQRLADAGFADPIYSVDRAAFLEENAAKTVIPDALYDEIQREADFIAASPEISDLLRAQGHSEVAIFWTDPETRVRCRAKIDRLCRDHWVDLKTFTIRGPRDVDSHIIREMLNIYYLQRALYGQALAHVMSGVVPAGDEGAAAIIDRLKARKEELTPIYVFTERGTPCIVARRFANSYANGEGQTLPSQFRARGDRDVRKALRAFRHCKEVFGDSPWMALNPDENFEEGLISEGWLDG